MSERHARSSRSKTTTDTSTSQHSGTSSRAKSLSPLSLRTPTIQTKLQVNTPGDAFEEQAEAVADTVTGTASMTAAAPAAHGGANSIQRQEAPEDDIVQREEMPEDETVQRQESPDDETVQRDGDGAPGVSARAASTIQHPGGGQPLPSSVQQRIEPHIGADLSHVRVHNDANAAQAASDLQARAFTYNNHIFLSSKDSSTDLRLMSHEATHVAQQGSVIRRQPMADEESAPLTPSSMPASSMSGSTGLSATATALAAAQPTPTLAPETPSAVPETAALIPPIADESMAQPEAPAVDTPVADEAAGGEVGTGTAPAMTGEGASGIELLMPEPPSELSPEAEQRLQGVQGRVGSAARSQRTMPPAGKNVAAAQGAVTVPEEQSKGEAENKVVNELQQGEPSPDIEELCCKIRETILKQRPADEDSLVKTKPQKVAEASGDQLNDKVSGDAQRVQGEYGSIRGEQKGKSASQPTAIEPQPNAQSTSNINAAQGAPDAVPAASVSLDADAEASRRRMDEAGMNSPAAQEVRSGPIAEARAAQGELEETAERDPAAVIAEQDTAIASAQADMAALQAQAQAALARSREEAASGTTKQQTHMIGSEEEMRRTTGAEANRIFAQAQKDVETQLRPLPQTAMQMWDSGITRHSTTFENSLKVVTDKIKERHSGVGGFFAGAWDWATGLPSWVKKAYDAAEQEFGDNVCKLIREISSAVNVIITNCQNIITTANERITALFKNLPQEMQGWAAEQQAGFQERLNGLTQRVNSARDDINGQLSDRASQAVQEVRERIHALRQAARGMLGRIADAISAFIDDPLRAIINGLLEILGIPPASFWRLVNTIESVIADIADNPMRFANNLMEALKQGFQRFFDNIGTHLINGLLNWLFSAMGNVGVTIPSDFSLKSLITFFLELMGISWARIRKLLAKHIGEQNVALIEQAWQLVSTLIAQGPQGIFEMIKDQFNPQMIIDMIIDTAIEYVKEALIKQVAIRIIGMLNPAGAIVQAIELIYKLLKWLFENAARIFSLIETIVNGVADLLAGNIGGMAEAVEKALARILPIVIDFLAGLMSLGDLPEKIAAKVKQLQNWVEKMLDRAIGWLANRAKALLRTLTGGKPDERTPEQKQSDLDSAISEADSLVADEKLSQNAVRRRLRQIKKRYKLTTLELMVQGDNTTQTTMYAHGEINPAKDSNPKIRTLKELLQIATPINYAYRNSTVVFLEEPLKSNYPSGIEFNSLGFPVFTPFAIKRVPIKMRGNRSYGPDGDFGDANEAAGYARNERHPNHTWHHHQDRITMELIPRDIHNAIRHSGGVSIIKYLGKR
jgi:hypothetical protein